MLKEGWRVEYSAASDSFTACPQSFKEFYNQRRRWMPSTMLNIIDLLGDWKAVVKKNDDISHFYMAYQGFNLLGSVLGPGSIFLMLIGAFSIAFGTTSTESMLINLALIVTFITSCCTIKRDHQILLAQFLTLIYAIIMIAVYIGIIIQIYEDGPLSLSALGFFCTFGSFILAAMIHPQEWKSIFCAVIYVATIPSMYLLLTVYALFNLNDESWGTREVAKSAEEKAAEANQKATEAAKKPKTGYLGLFQTLLDKKNMLGISRGGSDKDRMMAKILENSEKTLKVVTTGSAGDTTLHVEDETKPDDKNAKDSEKEKSRKPEQRKSESDEIPSTKFKERVMKVMKRHFPYWSKNTKLNRDRCSPLAQAKREFLGVEETKFWEDMIDEYLKPLSTDKKKQEKVAEELKNLKNTVALGFVLLNAMWITGIFILQSNLDVLGWKWPFGAKLMSLVITPENLEDANKITLNYTYLR